MAECYGRQAMRHTCFLLLFLFSLPSWTLASDSSSDLPACPQALVGLRSSPGTKAHAVKFRNGAGVTLAAFWVDFDGNEVFEFTLAPESSNIRNTFATHVYRFYATQEAKGKQTLVQEYIVGDQEFEVDVEPCAAVQATMPDFPRSTEFASLVQASDKACEGHSRFWSCTQRVPRKECEAQWSSSEFGLREKHAKAFGYVAGQTEDSRYNYQIDLVPRVTDGPGYLIMNMTPALKQVVSWYDQSGKKTAQPAGVVPGGYLDDGAGTLLVNLDRIQDKRNIIIQEMQDILEWWTQQRLIHTSTFGIRVYGHGAALINHVDRHDTHVASAVLQIGQEISEAGAGWPLEIITRERDCREVYLQPGQMVLYEGAHFKHGRPMHFRGDSFANVFSHFKPVEYNGIHRADL